MTIAAYLTALRWVDERVIAAGQLRQGGRIVDALRPRRSKLVPRQFVLAVTAARVVVFEAWGAGDALGIKPGIRAAFDREDVELTDLRATSATMRIRDERFTVSRLDGRGDPDTDQLIALLGGLPPLKVPQEPAWAAFSL